MKRNNLLYILLGSVLSLSSCSDFLDTMPDNRAEINTESKITNLLVSAYPTSTDVVMSEMASDNAMDNGARYNSTTEDKAQEESYLWQEITSTGNDSPKRYWDACYNAIAAANQALQAIDDMGNPDNLKAQRGEALLCRAYGHFALANLFCLPYNPDTADKDFGLPYSMAPETEVAPKYERGTMKELYEKIDNDIEAALPLVNDEIYSVPKYHFNRKAAYAFATRFNLYYKKLDKVIEYADVVLGAVPEKVLKNWYKIVIESGTPNWDNRVDLYINASEPANLLLLPVSSSWGYWGGPYDLGTRYGHSNEEICKKETGRAKGMWGAHYYLLPYKNMWGSNQTIAVSKIGGYFQYTDKVNGIGYRKNVILAFSTDETLLCRAEAYALKGELDKAVIDINHWLSTHTRMFADYSSPTPADKPLQVTKDQIIKFYSAIECMPLDNSKRTIKKEINPIGFKIASGDQKEMVQCILHLRRIETLHEGLRWQDIKRYRIEISHNRDGQANDELKADDPRRAFQLPADVINAGLQANPRN